VGKAKVQPKLAYACLDEAASSASLELFSQRLHYHRWFWFGSIHIEFPGRAMISVESGAYPALRRSILESCLRR
jgi:hypothetical protein